MPRFTHLLIVCLALVALALGTVVWRQRVEIRQLAAAQMRGSETLRLVRPRAAPAPRIAIPPRRGSGLAAGLGEEEGASAFSPAAVPVARAAALPGLLNNPDFLRALAVHQEGALDARFAPLFRRLKLRTEELAEFKRLLVEKDNAVLDVAAVTQEVAAPPLSPQAVQASIRAAQLEVENAIRRSLGQERYTVYSDYVNTLPQRATVMRLEQRLSYTGAPLQPEQAETLVAILAQNPAPETAARGLTTVPVHVGDIAPIASPSPVPATVSVAAIAQAETVLSPPQVSALRQVQGEMDASAQAADFMQRNIPRGEIPGGTDSAWMRFLLQ